MNGETFPVSSVPERPPAEKKKSNLTGNYTILCLRYRKFGLICVSFRRMIHFCIKESVKGIPVT